uniref:Gastricsin n=1 Tax=Mus spicilegus TaxID=10103 RepID=A0A8C6G8X4_MUSSI
MQPPVPLWLEASLTALIRWGIEAAIFSPFSFLIGNQASGWCSSSGCQGIVDTGTSLLVMPAQYLNELLQTIGAQEGEYGQYFVSCDSVSSLPTLTFVLNGVQFPLSPSSYIIQAVPRLWTAGPALS